MKFKLLSFDFFFFCHVLVLILKLNTSTSYVCYISNCIGTKCSMMLDIMPQYLSAMKIFNTIN